MAVGAPLAVLIHVHCHVLFQLLEVQEVFYVELGQILVHQEEGLDVKTSGFTAQTINQTLKGGI